MARARNIKPGFFKNEILGVADPLYSLLFEGLWVLADRAGRLEDRPLRIKAEIFPYREGLNVDAMLSWLQTNGFIERYTASGKKCILVLEFVKHQNPHKNETESELPGPPEKDSATDPIGAPNEEISTNTEKIGTASENIGSTRADSLSTDSLKGTNVPVAKADPQIPIQAVIDSYHELLPELPKVKLLNDKRKKSIKSFCHWVLHSKRSDGKPRAETSDEAIEWIRRYFDRAKENDFLMGREPRTNGHTGWQCDIDFLLSEKGRVHVIEKTRGAS